MERSEYDVVVVGSLNLDLVARTQRLPGPGETVAGSTFEEFAGGKGLNQAVAAARSGARVAMVGAVGDDHAGQHLRSVMHRDGIDDQRVATVESTPTGRAMIAVDDLGENSIIVVAGANARVAAPALPSTKVVLAQLEVPVDIVATAFGAARAAGATTMLNPAPATELPDTLLGVCDVVMPNEHELALIGGLDRLFGAGVGHVVVTLGAAGALLVTPDGAEHRVHPFPVRPIDTTGAGDAFCGALARRLAIGDPLIEALDYAAAAGALATTVEGAVPSQPRSDSIERLIGARRASADHASQ